MSQSQATKKAIDPELRAMEGILDALKDVPEDRRPAVLSYVADKMGIASTTSLKVPKNGPSPASNAIDNSIEEFMAAKNPSNTYQRFAALAYYLERNENVTELETGTLVEANSRASGPKVGNASQSFLDAENKYGFFAPGSERGKKRLTLRAKRIVEALPDQEAVKRVMDELPHRRAKAGKSRKNKS